MQKQYSKKLTRKDNMKLFGFAGTAHTPSYTASIMEKLSDELKRNGVIDTSVIVRGSDINVTMCKGCLSCYQSGNCVFDDCDGMSRLKNEILSSDIIVFGSPVYVHDISGTMKNFIDRFVVWMYLYRLVGKTAITVSTSTSNGNTFVDKYLKKVLKIMGAKVIEGISVNMLTTPEDINLQIKKCCEAVKYSIATGITEPDKLQEEYFSATRMALTNPLAKGYLVDYWNEKELAKYERYMDYYNSHLKTII